ncbi:MAG TPA: hemerythrin domain-containing protein [Nitrososphaerales archaeon]|nr:hemerythrin domain-containing protein [Nitrososphaerales archaeon]
MLKSPSSLDEEHEEIMGALRSYSQFHDMTGKAVGKLLQVLEPHFEKENQYVMPVLGSLTTLVTDEKHANLREIADSQAAILQEYDSMFKEHEEIRKLVSEAKNVSLQEKHQDVADLLDGLAHHARVEEEVLYPAALLAGTVAKFLMPAPDMRAVS